MIFTHNNILFIFSTKHTKWSKSRTFIKQGTSWLLHGYEPFFFCFIHQQITVIPKHTTKPEDISPGIKTKPQHSLGLPENSPKNPIRIIRKQSQKFSPNCPKTVPKNSVRTVKKQSQKFLKIPTLSPKML